MKLLFIKKKFSPHGGAELYLKQIMERLASRYEIHLLTQRWLENVPFVVHRLPSSPFLADSFFAFQAKRFVKRHLKEFPVVISFDRTLQQTIYRASDGCHLRWLNQRSLVESVLKCLSFNLNPHHLILKWLERECLANSKVIIVNSQMVKNDYEHFYGKAISDKCVVCYNGVDVKAFYPIRKEEKQDLRKKLNLPEEPLILFVGTGFVRKGLIFLLRTLRLLPKDHKLVVLGKDRRLKKFQRIASELGIKERVLFLGIQREVKKFYQAADVFVLPTIYDPFANVCLEAMACGLPVITTTANGVVEIIEEGKNGFIIDFPMEEEKLAHFIKKALQNREKMVFYARKTAEDFSLERAINEMVRIIENAYLSH